MSLAAAGASLVLTGVASGETTTGRVAVIWGCVGRPGVSSGIYGQCTIPPIARSGVSAISAGFNHSLAVKRGGVIAWGRVERSSDSGQCRVPAAARSGGTAVAAGLDHSLALKKNGSVVAWGCHGPGRNRGQCSVPASAGSDVVAIAAGGSQSLAL